MEWAGDVGIRGRHDRLGADGRWCPHRVPVDEVPPTPGLPEQRLLGPERAAPGRGRSQRALGPPPDRARHGGRGPERVALPRIRSESGHEAGVAVPDGRFLLQDLHATAVALAHLREGTGHVLTRREDRSRHPPPLQRQALHPSGCGGGRRRPGRDGRRCSGSRGRGEGAAGRTWPPSRWPPPLGRR